MNAVLKEEPPKTFHLMVGSWKHFARKKTPVWPHWMVAYNLLRDLPPKRGFTPVTNPVKLANGRKEWDTYESSLRRLKYLIAQKRIEGCPFGLYSTAEEVLEVLDAKLDALRQ